MTEATEALEAAARLDSAARESASAPAGNFLLEAPAGSGKTSVLTRRYLALLATVDDPGEILAITFTRKAAAEMRARIVRALRGEFDPADPQRENLHALAQAALAHGRSRGLRLGDEPQQLRIQTIDAFNHWLAAQLPVASRSCGVLEVTEDPGPLYARVARTTLAEAEADPQLAPDAGLLLTRLDNNWLMLERLIADMLGAREHWLPVLLSAAPARLCEIVDASLALHARTQLAALCALVPATLRARASALPGCGPLGAEPADLVHWRRLAHLTLNKTGSDWRQQLRVDSLGEAFADRALRARLRDLIGELRPIAGLHTALAALRCAPPAQLPAADARALVALARLLIRAAAGLQAGFAAAQRVDYPYVAGAARHALTEGGEPTELALRAGLRLRHILVDEFQDTSLAQVELLTILTAGWEPGDGRTLFVVGDPMQSIYRFRQAEVGRFLAVRNRGIGPLRLEPLQLTRNFRSSRALVDFVNATFATVLPPADDPGTGAVAYRPSVAAAADAAALPPGIGAVTLRRFADAETEAQALARRLHELRTHEPQASCAVLVAAHRHALCVIGALDAAGIPSLGVDLVALGERSVVRDLVQLGRALADRADRTAWLAVLRAPWCGARLTSLAALCGDDPGVLLCDALGDAARLKRCDPDDLPHLTRVHRVLTAALARPEGEPLADLLERVWLQLGGADACAPGELADARELLSAVAARWAAGLWRGAEDFEALVERLCSAPEPVAGAVQVMTIHRAKGLEFDHVFLPALGREMRGNERELLSWIELPQAPPGEGLLVAPTPAVGDKEPDALARFIGALDRERDAGERRRLLYVAATRARRSLWLSGAPPVRPDGEPRPHPRSLLACLWPALGAHFEAPGAEPAATAAAAPGRRTLHRLAGGWRPADPPPGVRLAPPIPPSHVASEPPEFSWADRMVRDIGTVVHDALARLARCPDLPQPEALEGEAAVLRGQLVRLGMPAVQCEEALGQALAALRRMLADRRGRWILRAGHREAHCEWELSGIVEGRLRNVKIDRCFVDEDGVRWVIDYKTSRHEGGDLDAFLVSELDRYRAQLDGYRSLAAAVGPEPVRAALYFPLLGEFRELA